MQPSIFSLNLFKGDGAEELHRVTNEVVADGSCIGPTEVSSSVFNGVCDWVYEEEANSLPFLYF